MKYSKLLKSKIPLRRESKNVIPTLHREAWEVFSQYIRRKDKGICFTCFAKSDWKFMCAGHFIHDRLDFDERNVHCQCKRCNIFLDGNLVEYTLKMIKMYGIQEVEELRRLAHQTVPWTRKGLEDIISTYKIKLEELDGR